MPPQLQNNQTDVPENKPKRSYAFLLTLTFLLLLSGVFGVWYFSQVPPQDEAGSVATKDQFADWKTYRNEELGFEFEYPNTWTQGGNTKSVYFLAYPEIGVLQLSYVDSVISPKELASNLIKENNCPYNQDSKEGDHLIRSSEKYSLIALYCSISSEDYVYILKLTPNKLIKFSYHDDFNENWTEEQKLKTLDDILSTFEFIPSQSKVTSGIQGTVTIGPTCPVQKNPPDPNCADRPFQAGFNVIDQEGKTVKSFSSDENGKFSVDLDPGTYVIRNIPAPGTYPRTSPQNVTVSDGKYTELNLQFDSGIR